jgi:hypothetical protein
MRSPKIAEKIEHKSPLSVWNMADGRIKDYKCTAANRSRDTPSPASSRTLAFFPASGEPALSEAEGDLARTTDGLAVEYLNMSRASKINH